MKVLVIILYLLAIIFISSGGSAIIILKQEFGIHFWVYNYVIMFLGLNAVVLLVVFGVKYIKENFKNNLW